MHAALRERVRVRIGRNPQPSAQLEVGGENCSRRLSCRGAGYSFRFGVGFSRRARLLIAGHTFLGNN